MSDTIDTIDTSTCNTNIRSRAWQMTINNYTDEDIIALNGEKVLLEDWAWQEEIGENGTKHLQIGIKYNNARSFNTIKTKFPRAHIEKCKCWAALKKYCCKEETRTGACIDSKLEPKIKDPLEGHELYDWQQQVCNLIETEPDDRTVHWYYDKVGCKGKTSLAKHLCLEDENCLYLSGKCADMKYGIFKRLEQGKKIRTIIIDLVRSMETYVSYDGIESIKNGIFYNSKYESTMVLFDSPHMIVLANFLPDMDRLSLDRWDIHEI